MKHFFSFCDTTCTAYNYQSARLQQPIKTYLAAYGPVSRPRCLSPFGRRIFIGGKYTSRGLQMWGADVYV